MWGLMLLPGDAGAVGSGVTVKAGVCVRAGVICAGGSPKAFL